MLSLPACWVQRGLVQFAICDLGFSDSRLSMEPSDHSRNKDFLLSSAFGEAAECQSETPAPIFSPDDVIGERYRVIRFIARGGMGEVYEVEDEELHSRVALKTIRADIISDPRAIDRFKREILLGKKCLASAGLLLAKQSSVI